MEVYFDNCATTPVIPPVKEIVDYAMTEAYGNPSALHRKGLEAEQLIKTARAQIADTLKVQPKEILFTSGGTESNNLALIGGALAMQRRGRHIITMAIEHPSVYQPLTFLEEMGFETTVLPVDHLGHISLDELEKSLRDDTIMVSTMYVNNEMGAIAPVEEIAAIVHRRNPAILYHVDGIQAYGKLRIRPARQGIDLLSVSGHKFHAPKGVGFLYVRQGVRLHPLMLGGGQQGGMRSGTENVPGCAGLGVAAREIYTGHEEKVERLYQLRERLIAGLHRLDGVVINGAEDRTNAPQIVSASFRDVRAEVLLHALEERGVYVSSGSACSSNHPGISGTLKGIGVRQELLDATLRFSFSILNTPEEVDYCLEQLAEILPVLRRFRRF